MAGLNLPEDEAAAALIQAINEALANMRDVVTSRLGELSTADAAFLNQMTQDLMALADDEARKILEGQYGDILEQTALMAGEASSIPGALGMINPDMVAIAMYNSQVYIKDLLEEGVKDVNMLITNAIVTGKTPREISADIRDQITLGSGENQIPEWRADMIARNEVFSVYRQTSKSLADEYGVEKFKLVGPDDDRTDDICVANLGKIKTAEEWQNIEPLAFVYGLHYNCRHTLDAVLQGANE